jgi:hypothetical protein
MRTDLTYEGIATYHIFCFAQFGIAMRTDLTYEGIATIATSPFKAFITNS